MASQLKKSVFVLSQKEYTPLCLLRARNNQSLWNQNAFSASVTRLWRPPVLGGGHRKMVTTRTIRLCKGFDKILRPGTLCFRGIQDWERQQQIFFATTSHRGSNTSNMEKEKKDRSSQRESFPSLDDPNLLTVAILGPPNAGKSTLYNRLLDKTVNKAYRLNTEKNARRQRKKAMSQARIGYNATNRRGGSMAIVSSMAGTTRDRRECIGRLGPTYVRLVDTAGVDGRMWQRNDRDVKVDTGSVATAPYNREKDLLTVEQRMMSQSLVAAQKADLILLMFDARRGTTRDVYDIVRWLRKLPPSEVQFLNLNGRRKGRSKDTGSSENRISFEGGCTGIDLEEMQREIRKEDIYYNPHERDLEEENVDTVKRKRVVAVLANKLEGDRWALDAFDQTDNNPKYDSFSESAVMEHLTEAARLGLGEPIPISAEHGDGMSDIAVIAEALTRRKKKHIQSKSEEIEDIASEEEQSEGDDDEHFSSVEEKPLQLAILGRPNVGKSTLVNALLKEDRVVTGATPGLTRDAIAVEWRWDDRPVKIVDTAGIRKKKQREVQDPSTSIMSLQTSSLLDPANGKNKNMELEFDPTIEDLAVQDAMRAMKTANVAVLVVEATQGLLQRQEIAIVDAVVREGRALVIAANKMDLLEINSEYRPEHFARQVQEQIETRVPVLRNTPVVAMSSLNGDKVDRLMPVVFEARERWAQKISTGLLNRWLDEVIDGQPPPMVQGRQVKIKYVIQTKGRPPTFLLFASTDKIPETYLRYLTRNFQDTFRMFGMEVRLALKPSSPNNPFHTKAESDGPKKGQTRRKTRSSGIGGAERRKEKTLKQLRTTGRVDKSRRARRLGKW